MKLLPLVAAIALAGANVAQAETASIATTTPSTPIHFFGLAMSKAADEISGMDLRIKPYKSSGQGAVFVNRGEVDFGLHNAIVLQEAYLGVNFYEGKRLENLRAVARLIPFQLTFGVPGDSDIRSVADMAGKRFPAGFDATSFGERLYEAMLGTEGLSYADVEAVQVSDWGALGKAFIRGDVDVNGFVVGSGTVLRYMQAVPGGFRAVSLPDTPEALARLQEVFPLSRLAVVEPAENLPGIGEPTTVMEYDYWLFAHAGTSDEVVTAMLESLYQGQETLAAVSASFRDFDPALMQDDIGVPLHPAAEAFYADKAAQ